MHLVPFWIVLSNSGSHQQLHVPGVWSWVLFWLGREHRLHPLLTRLGFFARQLRLREVCSWELRVIQPIRVHCLPGRHVFVSAGRDEQQHLPELRSWHVLFNPSCHQQRHLHSMPSWHLLWSLRSHEQCHLLSLHCWDILHYSGSHH